MSNFLNIFKDNKNLKYAVNIFILLVIISLILKLDTTSITSTKTPSVAALTGNEKKEVTTENYVYSLEKRLEEILGKIENVENVDVMIYTKNTPEMKPVYDENISNETNIEIGGDGTKREVKRETKQNQVIQSNNQVVSKYYEYPEISGVLVVANYSGNKDIYTVLMNCVKTLLDINLNDIEVVLSNR